MSFFTFKWARVFIKFLLQKPVQELSKERKVYNSFTVKQQKLSTMMAVASKPAYHSNNCCVHQRPTSREFLTVSGAWVCLDLLLLMLPNHMPTWWAWTHHFLFLSPCSWTSTQKPDSGPWLPLGLFWVPYLFSTDAVCISLSSFLKPLALHCNLFNKTSLCKLYICKDMYYVLWDVWYKS